ncbi:TonB-dependent receptor, partial [Rhizobium leguminosarum]|uniref:TonB-dependent receptor domain-containing protein n=1 Tax=Rhizobium leguminosarum TaxID=384 RepID=UPI003F953F3F
NIMALYGNYEFQITPSFSTTIGGRYQVINDPINNQKVFTPQWQTLYKINESKSIYTNVGKAFTMPNIHDAFKWVTDLKD